MDDLVLKKIVLEVINQLNKTCIDSVFVLSDNNSFCFKNELENMGYKVDISNNACDFNNHCMFIIDDLSADIISSISNLLYKDSNTSFIINALLSGKKVLALHRSKIGNIDVKSIKIGEWRYLSKKEVAQLKSGI